MIVHRYRYDHMTGREFNAALSYIGMSESEFCRLTGVRERTLMRWLGEEGPPHWVRVFLALVESEDNSIRAHAVTDAALIPEAEYRELEQN